MQTTKLITIAIALCFSTFAKADFAAFPMKVGYEWQYDVQANGGACASGRFTAKFTEQFDYEGHPGYVWQSYCSYSAGGSFIDMGDQLDFFYGGSFTKVLSSSMKDGDTWEGAGGSAISAHLEKTVIVPAGTFHDCWTIHLAIFQTDVQNTYCPGVGLTKVLQTDGPNSLRADLVSKNFALRSEAQSPILSIMAAASQWCCSASGVGACGSTRPAAEQNALNACRATRCKPGHPGGCSCAIANCTNH